MSWPSQVSDQLLATLDVIASTFFNEMSTVMSLQANKEQQSKIFVPLVTSGLGKTESAEINHQFSLPPACGSVAISSCT